MAASERPVVIQTMWRTGGTYFSFHLREANRVALFYEPLHEDYSRYTRAEWDGFAQAGAEAALGHPRKAFHYLTDYPFVAGAGVEGHRPEFAFERFILGRDDEHAALASYFEALTRHAEASGRRPLFKFCRGFLRRDWLDARLGAKTLFLARLPQGMIGSYAKIGHAGEYFYSGFLHILRQNRGERLLAPVHDYVASTHPDYRAVASASPMNELAATTGRTMQRDVFLFFWALAVAAHADAECLTIDAEIFGSDARSRAASAERLRCELGLDVDLADAVALDPGEPGLARFADPAPFARPLAEAVARTGFDPSFLTPPIRRQFEALVPLG